MTTESRGWPFAAASLLICTGLYFAVRQALTVKGSFFNTAIVPGFGVAAALLSLFLGYFSYPRVQNLKVYLAGFLSGSITLLYFLLVHYSPFVLPFLPRPSDGFVFALYLIGAIHLSVLVFVPSFVKYRTAGLITVCAILATFALSVFLRLYPFAVPSAVLRIGGRSVNVVFFLPALLSLIVAVLSLLLLRQDFFLGGIFSGCAIIAGFGCVLRTLTFPGYHVDRLVFSALPLFLVTGIVIHWAVRMEHRALYDPLLKIYNRTYCSQIIAEQSPLDTRPPFTAAMIDIDHFKRVNDTYGHQCGDGVLFTVAQAVQKEAVPDGTLCRYGGEELIVFFPGKTLREVRPILERIREAVSNTSVAWGRHRVAVTVSIGASCRDHGSRSIDEVIKAADKALYSAKQGGRNQVRTAGMRAPVSTRSRFTKG